MICVVQYVPGTVMVFTAVITPINSTHYYCCYFATTDADAGDGAFHWCCFIFAAAAATSGAPAAALYS